MFTHFEIIQKKKFQKLKIKKKTKVSSVQENEKIICLKNGKFVLLNWIGCSTSKKKAIIFQII